VPSKPLVATVATLLLVLAGCSERTAGDPSAGGEPPASTVTTDEPTSESSGAPADGGTADLQPCDMLDQADLSALQLTGGEEKKVGSARVCRYQRDGATLNETFTVSVELFDHQSMGDLNAPDITPLDAIGGHEAKKFTDDTGTCGVSLGVGRSRVDNTAVGGDQQLGCQLAEQLATTVAPKLPEG
jgi:hypothetical protein